MLRRMSKALLLRVIGLIARVGGPVAICLFILIAAVVAAFDEFMLCGTDLHCYTKNVELPEVLQ